jgi:hypothetical protein
MKDVTLKAIETHYKGYHFRSRLEARWAVFFDTLGIKYEYEAQGFDLDGEWYLPDFWLPAYSTHVEIKPLTESRVLTGLDKLRAMSSVGAELLVLQGNPWPWEYETFLAGRLTNKMLLYFPTGQFAQCRTCGSLVVVASSPDGRVQHSPLLLEKDGPSCEERYCPGPYCWNLPGMTPAHDLLDSGYIAARSARFEHGQNGTPR